MDIAELGFNVNTAEVISGEKALNKLTPATNKAEKATDKLNDQFDRGAKSASRFDRAASGISKGLSGIAAGLAGGILGGLAFGGIEQTVESLAAGLMNVADSVEHMGNIAAATGGSVGGVQVLTIAMKAAGVEMGEVEAASKKLNTTLGDIAIGSGPGAKLAKAALDQLGLSADKLRMLDVDQRFIEISNAIKDAGLSASQSAALLDNLGIKSTNMIAALSGGGAAIEGVREQITSMGLALTEVDEKNLADLDAAFDELGVTGEAAGTKIAAVFSPLVSGAINISNALITRFAEKFGEIVGFAQQLYALSADTIYGTVKEAGAGEDAIVRGMAAQNVLTKTFDNLTTSAANAQNAINGTFDAVDNLNVAATGVTPTLEGLELQTATFDETTSALTPTLESLASGFDTVGVAAAAVGASGGPIDQTNHVLQSAMDYAEQTRKAYEELSNEVRDSVTDAFKGFFTDLMHGTSIIDAATNALGKLADRLMGMVLDNALSGIIGSLFGGGTIAGGAAIPSGGFIPGITGPKLFANGGVFGGPTAFDTGSGLGVAGEAGPEAILPLHRAANGGLGVAMAANDNYGGGSPFMLNVNIYNNAANDVDVTTQTADDGSLVVQIDKAVAKNLADPSSQTNKAMQRSFGVSNTTVAR